jgi:hypothetical protein
MLGLLGCRNPEDSTMGVGGAGVGADEAKRAVAFPAGEIVLESVAFRGNGISVSLGTSGSFTTRVAVEVAFLLNRTCVVDVCVIVDV